VPSDRIAVDLTAGWTGYVGQDGDHLMRMSFPRARLTVCAVVNPSNADPV